MIEWYWLLAVPAIAVFAAIGRGWTRSRALYDALVDPEAAVAELQRRGYLSGDLPLDPAAWPILDRLAQQRPRPRSVGVMPQPSAVIERPSAPGRIR